MMNQSLILSEQLPIAFKVTDIAINEMTCSCSLCNEVIPDECISANVTRVIESVAEIRGVASCPCGEVEKFIFRVRSNGTIQVSVPDGWQEHNLLPQPNVADRVINYIKGLFP